MSAVKRSLNVGVVGMGNMGIPITRNLAFKARSAMYLQIHSRTLSKARRVCDDLGVDGATCAMRLHDRYSTMTKWCDVIVLSLANRAAAEQVLLEDAEAIIANARPGQIIVDHTTVDVELSRVCAMEAERRGATFLDVPISGSPRAAFNGQLVLMAGGSAESFQRMLPIFRLYADTIHHMGASGSGSATKLLSQALVASHNAAAAEAMTIANRLGIEDQGKLVQVLDASWGSSTMLRRNAPTMQDLIRNPDKLAPTSGASVDHLLEDLSLLDTSLAHPVVAPSGTRRDAAGNNSTNNGDDEEEKFPVLDASLRMLGSASEAGMGDRDLSAAIHFIQAAAGLELDAWRGKKAAGADADVSDIPMRGLSAGAFTSSAAAAAVGGALEKQQAGHGDVEAAAPVDAPVDFSIDDFY